MSVLGLATCVAGDPVACFVAASLTRHTTDILSLVGDVQRFCRRSYQKSDVRAALARLKKLADACGSVVEYGRDTACAVWTPEAQRVIDAEYSELFEAVQS